MAEFAVPADYNSDGKDDPAIWDSRNAMVKILGDKLDVTEIPTRTSEDMIAVTSPYRTK